MKPIFRRTPSPALVISCIALAVALSGVGYAAVALPRNSVGTAQLKANAVNSAKVKAGSLLGSDFKAGQLPAGATGAQGPKGERGPAGSDAQLTPEAWHEIEPASTPGGEPDFLFGWTNLDATSYSSAAFYRDRSGVVHLKGIVKPGTSNVIFGLPGGYWPALGSIFATATDGGVTDGHVYIDASDFGVGTVTAFRHGTDWISLDGISFRCAPSGSDGCP